MKRKTIAISIIICMVTLIFQGNFILPFSSAKVFAAENTYYVDDSNGADASDGSISQPWKTISKAASTLTAGDTVIIRAGTYRETVLPQKSGTDNEHRISYVADSGVVVSGADILTYKSVSGWTQDTSNTSTWSTPFLDHLTYTPDQYQSALAQRREMIIVDGEVYMPVATKAELRAKTFWVEGDANVAESNLNAYVCFPDGNPANHTVEVSKRNPLFDAGSQSFLTVKGFTFRYADNGYHQHAVSAGDSSIGNNTFENDIVEWNNYNGIAIGWTTARNNVFKNCVSQNNGGLGWAGSTAGGTELNYDQSLHNNWKNFNSMWEAGGGKFCYSKGLTINHFYAADNNGVGLWFDVDNDAAIIENSTFARNYIAGLMIEFNSNNTVIKNNVMYGNYGQNGFGAGIFQQAANHSIIENNTIYGNEGPGIWIHMDPRANTGFNQIYNNVVANNGKGGVGPYGGTSGLAEISLEEFSLANVLTNKLGGNVYYHPSGDNISTFYTGSGYGSGHSTNDISQWRTMISSSGETNETNSRVSDPLLDNTYSDNGWHIAGNSPARDAGVTPPVSLTEDKEGDARPAIAPDAGADQVNDGNVNLIKDGSFEANDLAAWTQNSVSADSQASLNTDSVCSPNHAAKFGPEAGGMGQEITAGFTAGTPYVLSCWGKYETEDNGGIISVQYWNGGTKISEDVIPINNPYYKEYTKVVNIPIGTTKLVIGVWKNLGNGYLYLDNIQLEPADSLNHGFYNGNMVLNPDFENGTTNWGAWGTNMHLITNEVYDGVHALQVGSSNAIETGVSQTLTTGFTVGQTYNLSGWAKYEGNNAGTSIQAKMLDSSLNVIGQVIKIPINNVDYTKYNNALTVPIGTTTIKIELIKAVGSGTAYFDDIKLVGTTDDYVNDGSGIGGGTGTPLVLSANLLQSPDFENGTTGWTGVGATIATTTTTTAHGGTNSLAVTDRPDYWAGADQAVSLPGGKMISTGIKYSVSGFMKLGITPNTGDIYTGTLFLITKNATGDTKYKTIATTALNNTWKQINSEFTLDANDPDVASNFTSANLRVSSGSGDTIKNEDLYLDDFSFAGYGLDTIDSSTVLGPNLIRNSDLESGNVNYWWPNANTAGETIETTSNEHHGGSYSLKATNRNASWAGIEQNLILSDSSNLPTGKRYIFSGYVKLAKAADGSDISEDANIDLLTATSDWSKNTLKHIAIVHASSASWTPITAEFTVGAHDSDIVPNYGIATVLFTTSTGVEDFYIDDISLQGYNVDIQTPIVDTGKTTPAIGDKLGYWNFDSLDGTNVQDSSLNGNNGTNHGANLVDGKFGKALHFDGTNSVTIPEALSLRPDKQVTVAAWVKFDGVQGDYTKLIFHGADKDIPYAAYGLELLWPATGNNIPSGHVTTTNNNYYKVPGQTDTNAYHIIDNNWHQVTMTYDGLNEKLYIDGTLSSTTAVTGDIQGYDYSGLGIAGNSTGNPVTSGGVTKSFFKGSIDEVQIYNKALSTDEIAQLQTKATLTSDEVIPNVTALSAGITTAQALYAGATEGTADGNYAVGSKATLLAAITDAQAVVTNATSQTDIDGAVTTLEVAVDTFNNGKIVPTHNTAVLSLAIKAAQALYDSAEKGTGNGNAVGLKAKLQLAITHAKAVVTNAATTSQSDIDAEVATLNASAAKLGKHYTIDPKKGK